MGNTEFNTDDHKLIDTIQRAVKTETIEVGGKPFVTREVYLVPEKRQAERLNAHSLTAIVDYIKSGFDAELIKDCTIVVVSPVEVELQCSISDRTERRFSPLVAIARTPTINFGHFLSLEEANIMLQSRFAETDERDALIASLSHIVATESLAQGDDGMSQEVTMKRSIKRTDEAIKNPVELCPFRTFIEITQPESPCVVRLRKPSDDLMQVALFEADGGAWQHAACRNIKAFLDQELAGSNVSVLA